MPSRPAPLIRRVVLFGRVRRGQLWAALLSFAQTPAQLLASLLLAPPAEFEGTLCQRGGCTALFAGVPPAADRIGAVELSV